MKYFEFLKKLDVKYDTSSVLFCPGCHQLVHGPRLKYSLKLYFSWRCTAASLMVKPWSPSDRSLFNCLAPCLVIIGTSVTFCSSDEPPPTNSHSSKYAFSRCLRLESKIRAVGLSETLFSFSGLKSGGVAPLPPCCRKLLDETVKTIAVFPAWLHLLDGEDNCMMSVPLSTSDLHYSS